MLFSRLLLRLPLLTRSRKPRGGELVADRRFPTTKTEKNNKRNNCGIILAHFLSSHRKSDLELHKPKRKRQARSGDDGDGREEEEEGKSSEMEGEAKRASKKSFFSRLLPSTREEKKKKANEAKWLALGSFNSLDGLKLFVFIPSWLIVARWFSLAREL
jgi:hypothetical protein